MKNNKWRVLGCIVTGAAFIGFAVSVALADNQVVPFTPNGGGGGITNSSIGIYYGLAKLTNGSGSFWFTPPTNVTSGTLSDISGFGPPYSSVANAACINMKSWCGTNSVTFPATNTMKYSLTVYVKSTPPPTNGQPVSVQIVWQ
jgi:hypothetical protein